jgi:hypothetical protein
VFVWRAQELEEWHLRRFEAEYVVEPAVEHQRRDADAG